MARKVQPPKPRPAPAGRDDLNIMLPDCTLRIGDREVTVREYRFAEGAQMRVKAAPILDRLADLGTRGNLELEAVLELFDDNILLINELIAQSCDQPAEWISGLSAQDGERLLGVWWGVNGGFFLRRVLQRTMSQLATKAFGGRASLQPSRTNMDATANGLPPITPSAN